MNLTKKVVKKKKLQNLGGKTSGIIIPKAWIDEIDWNQKTKLVLEFLPNRQTIIISEENEENSDIISITD